MKKSIIIEQGENPSADFFVLPHLLKNVEDITRYNLALSPPTNVEPGLSVIFVRYITPQWQRWVEQHGTQLERVVFFMDDDLFDLSAHAGLPLRYRFKLWRFAYRHQSWLRQVRTELWVSTPWLAEKYARWQPIVLQPQSPYSGLGTQKTLFYHGSASHRAEFKWLYPVFEQVLRQDHSISVELIGNQKVRRQFAALPRVHVLHPMSWLAYQALLARPGRCIGLAPLLDNGFNAARAPTKFFDITQAGAVGIYADHPVYRTLVRHEYNGLLLPMEQQAWIDAILRLSNDEQSRVKMIENARNRE